MTKFSSCVVKGELDEQVPSMKKRWITSSITQRIPGIHLNQSSPRPETWKVIIDVRRGDTRRHAQHMMC